MPVAKQLCAAGTILSCSHNTGISTPELCLSYSNPANGLALFHAYRQDLTRSSRLLNRDA